MQAVAEREDTTAVQGCTHGRFTSGAYYPQQVLKLSTDGIQLHPVIYHYTRDGCDIFGF